MDMNRYKKTMLLSILVLIPLAGIAVIVNAETTWEDGDCRQIRQFTFSWSFQDQCNMLPRGGTSKGAKVTLDPEPHPDWLSLQEKGLTDYERDRRAILAMAGPYRTSFDFLEVAGYTPDFSPDQPYQSWGTEYVYVVEDRKDFITLQHIMVMYFVEEDGTISEPMVMKHWRQDWQYEKKELLTYQGNNTWRKTKVPRSKIKGTWAQAVYQVDDSPRYEAYGSWRHEKNFSTWLSSTTWRPLPRREYSVRSDYQILEATNRHTIIANGWIHEEENYKVVLDKNGKRVSDMPYLAKELGINRYERIIEHDFSEGDRYWQTTGSFWSDVRDTWSSLIKKNKTLRLKKNVDGKPLFMPLFQQAGKIVSGEPYLSKSGKEDIKTLLTQYLLFNE